MITTASEKNSVTVNESNQITQSITNCCTSNYLYNNGSIIKSTVIQGTGTNQKVIRTSDFEYTTGKYFFTPQSLRPAFLYTFYWFTVSSNWSLFGSYLGQSSPAKTTVYSDAGSTVITKIAWINKLNSQNFPSEIQIVFDTDVNTTSPKQQKFNYKLTYNNCQ
ncbi:hypothetical protein HNV11_12230 [Spirosoma taeanense]|uniref:Uncharacterized protein n=1 Tax=Spirosoma taeanense TaxID=2735870 RepID=A0A6M5Y9Q6_9BACT|nr:hypothetical protein [Spirosoma taeanense]QJW90086.1 hypothetical protein HNV11_12230 [Spirosoma taeanense]